ncbi:MAG TPA: hypothetical protein VMN37_13005 [Gemmatimonadales bacterium]|nr:hypothetical protein [Gemmatimonadales bacterium]
MPLHSTRLGPEPEPVLVEMQPAVLHDGQSAELVVRSPAADSIVFQSLNGVDTYWVAGPELRTVIGSDFGDATPVTRYAGHRGDRLLDVLKKPARIAVCRQGRCTEHYHEIAVRLPERNRRSVALTAGYSSVFARRSILGPGRTVLFKEVLTSGVWSMQGEWASGPWNAQAQGFLGGGEHGGSLDVSRMLVRGDGLSYGLTLHAGMTHSEWLLDGPGAVPGHTAFRAGIGPSVMLKGITASSLLGISSDGVETLQISSTRVSVNGNLTSVRHPVTITAEKTFAFGGGPIVSRRRDALERLTAGIRVVDDLALNLGLSSHRMAWPEAHPSDDLRASETVVTLGGQYSVTW